LLFQYVEFGYFPLKADFYSQFHLETVNKKLLNPDDPVNPVQKKKEI
jgi:hypothetical protein